MEFYSFTKPGRWHRDSGEKNQDQLFGIHGGDRSSICLSDGCGSSPYGREAAQLVVVLLARMLFERFYELLLDEPDTVRRKVCSALQPALREFATERGIDPETLAATVMAFAADNTGRYLCVHLGDGAILMQPQGAEASEFLTISAPSRGVIPHSTYLTMNADMMRHLKVYQSLGPFKGKILLLTDGADDLLQKEGQKSCLPCPLYGPMIEAYLDGLNPQDDYSAAVVIIR